MIPNQLLEYLNTHPNIARYSVEPVPYDEPGLNEDNIKVEHSVISVSKRDGSETNINFFRVVRLPNCATLWYSAFPGFHNDFNNRMTTKEIVEVYDELLK